MSKTLAVPTHLSWNEAPEKMPEPGHWVLVLIATYPQIACASPDQFSGWAKVDVKTRTKTIEQKVFADFDEIVYWSPLPALDELRFISESGGEEDG